MDNGWHSGTWLLVDAAGPVAITGLIRDGKWLDRESNEEDFLGWFQGSVESLLKRNQLDLDGLKGVIYASGPGSTLGLRLAAMFVRTLMEIPELRHWRCFQYQNLELTATGLAVKAMVAPWKRDQLHHSESVAGQSPKFKNSAISPLKASEKKIPGVVVGRRPANISESIDWRPYPLEQIPEILTACPTLLTKTSAPLPYSAEDPQFARWSSKRHTAS